jgi:manganese efflux pump family protein
MITTAFVLAFALAADAFAASLIQGVAARGQIARVSLRCGLFFGLAQGLMPILGWVLGLSFVGGLARFDHWIAFAILAFLGLRMVKEGLTKGPEDAPAKTPANGWPLILLAIATSIDAAAAGLTLPTMALDPFFTCAIIGIVTATACAFGVWLGARAGPALGEKAEVVGGLMLVSVGVKVLYDHGVLSF